MALHESVLEEFGLTTLWVRRGMAVKPQVEGAGQDAQALTGHAGHRDDVRGAVGAESVPLAQDTQRPAIGTGEMPQTGRAQMSGEHHAPAHDEQVAPSARAPERFDDRAASARASEPSRATQQSEGGERRMQPAHDAAQDRQATPGAARQQPHTAGEFAQQAQHAPSRQPVGQARSPALPPFDAPPDDDFAWFDDLPAHAPSQARREAPELPSVHTLDWDALSERVAECRLCRLCEKRTNTVFGVGDRAADWMLIGEAPGENEDRLGEPFVGQAGKLLDNMLHSLALARETNVYIANVIKCRPPGNRNPEPDEVLRCEPYLQRQVGLVKPKLIVAMGRFAAQSLLKTDASISSLRGRVHEYEGVPVIVTYHPAYLLRRLPDKAKAWADLCLARDTWREAGGAPSNAAK
ncbi:uracil-DNA glycosylase [Burkholderia sp. SG-MS1]|uniref:uracil-DNA glycosylase n=1 Tax=Paraburkholderia sp. SG-MS1 TaxID=2023741 RepID=UPI0014486985|nr:uracil-DNA glycosylase [Paraburkholderia sp. SG-MS1]NKJ51317.1 uracil-DNA glycosylase [Paraburkholderia sp. SG-MS1]